MIKATVREIAHVDPVDPEPGTGYGWSWKSGNRDPLICGLGMIADRQPEKNRESGGIFCT